MMFQAVALRELDWRPPSLGRGSIAVWRRNVLVWRKLMGASLLFNFGEPLLYLVGLGYGLGMFISEMGGLPYRTFLATGLLASSAMTTASMEGLYSVYTRMVPQETYDGMLATPLEVDDIVAGELFWCATKGLISSAAILVVALVLGAIHSWGALLCVPAFFLVGLCFAGPALLVTAVARAWDVFAYYVTLAITPMFIFCGVFYPTSSLPASVQNVVSFLPLTHAVLLIRPLAAGTPVTDAPLHIVVLVAYALVGFYLAVVLTRRRLIQ